MEKLIRFYENNGYPFALAKLDSFMLDAEKISAHLVIEKNILILIKDNVVGVW